MPLVDASRVDQDPKTTVTLGAWMAMLVFIGAVALAIAKCSGAPTEERRVAERGHSIGVLPEHEAFEQDITAFGVATKMKVLELLKDPDSATFRNVVAYSHPSDAGYVFCGEVNAKNGVGGYSGYQRFAGNPIAVALESMDAMEFQKGWNQFCDPSLKVEDARWF